MENIKDERYDAKISDLPWRILKSIAIGIISISGCIIVPFAFGTKIKRENEIAGEIDGEINAIPERLLETINRITASFLVQQKREHIRKELYFVVEDPPYVPVESWLRRMRYWESTGGEIENSFLKVQSLEGFDSQILLGEETLLVKVPTTIRRGLQAEPGDEEYFLIQYGENSEGRIKIFKIVPLLQKGGMDFEARAIYIGKNRDERLQMKNIEIADAIGRLLKIIDQK